MERPARCLLVGLTIAAGVSWGRAAEPASNLSIARERVVSPRVAGMLAAAGPIYSPPSSPATPATEMAEVAAARPAASERVTPANGIVRLPDYVVRERKPPKLPDPEEVMPRRQLEQIAMQRHLGDEQGLERALSMLTPVHLWRRIPVLGRFPLVTFETNEQRAMRMDEAAKIKARWDALAGLMSPELRPSPPAAPAPTARP